MFAGVYNEPDVSGKGASAGGATQGSRLAEAVGHGWFPPTRIMVTDCRISKRERVAQLVGEV